MPESAKCEPRHDMDIFNVHEDILKEYEDFTRSFLRLKDERLQSYVEQEIFERDTLWPHAILQLNPAYVQGASVQELVDEGLLHEDCAYIFRTGSKPFRLHVHQEEAVRKARGGRSFVVTTGTGSGKSLAFFLPIVDGVLRSRGRAGVQAILVYPMNALVNSQLKSFLDMTKGTPVRVRRYTGQESSTEKGEIQTDPPHILLTNYMMLEYILTRPRETRAFLGGAESSLKWIVFDELHTYRGRQGADVALLVRRLAARFPQQIQFVGTSATMISEGSTEERREAVATFASRFFGTSVEPQDIIEEQLQRIVPGQGPDGVALRRAVEETKLPDERDDFLRHPLAFWVEDHFGIRLKGEELVRGKPRSVVEGAQELAVETGAPYDRCLERLKEVLLRGNSIPEHNRDKVFEFRVHQFFSQGGAVHATLESYSERLFRLEGLLYFPEAEAKRYLYPLVFCRSCGQDYYVCIYDSDKGEYAPRAFRDFPEDDEGSLDWGYLFLERGQPRDVNLLAYPDHWYDTKGRIKSGYRASIPKPAVLAANGKAEPGGMPVLFLKGKFRLCLSCGEAHDGRTTEFRKLSGLSTEGRSTATTMLSFSSLLSLRKSGAERSSMKVLSFSDNRQDASLQSGHFNDFVQVGMLRAALLAALVRAEGQSIPASTVALTVRDILLLDQGLESFAREDIGRPIDPGSRQAQFIRDAFLHAVEYRLYQDLQRGWRFVQPNLEQCGLLKVTYAGVDDAHRIVQASDEFRTLAELESPELEEILTPILGEFRRALAVDAPALGEAYHVQLMQESNQYLNRRWRTERNDRYVEHARFRLVGAERRRGERSLGTRSIIGKWIKRKCPGLCERLGHEPTIELFASLLVAAGLVVRSGPDDNPWYRLKAGCIEWNAYDGPPEPDWLRSQRATGGEYEPVETRPNAYFRRLYQERFHDLENVVGAEHTAQIQSLERIRREDEFKEGRINSLFCSPTMELGIDISDLNVVHMRNVPPGPANYAQRSGRSGRAGQSALVMTYCTAGGGHDQYYFKHREEMVAGAVRPPRLELSNQALLKSHVHAVWLQKMGLDLGSSIGDIVDLSKPNLPLHSEWQSKTEMDGALVRVCLEDVQRMLAEPEELSQALDDEEIEDILLGAPQAFDSAFDTWRELYRSADAQQLRANERERNMVRIRDRRERKREESIVRRMRSEAMQQINLLLAVDVGGESEFYPYRYLAGEGFLPAYSFPARPLRTFVPSGETAEFITRSSTMALREFGPRNIIYHDGRKYEVNRLLLRAEDRSELLERAKVCSACGYIHFGDHADSDTCRGCEQNLRGGTGEEMHNLLRMPDSATRARDKISSEEEVRRRMGFLIDLRYSFAGSGAIQDRHDTVSVADGLDVCRLTYGPAANLWQINRRWVRSKDEGFAINLDTGWWQRKAELEEEADADDWDSGSAVERVRLFVSERTNILLLQPLQSIGPEDRAKFVHSLRYALIRAMQAFFQVEDDELGVELVGEGELQRICIYEDSAGSLGILAQIVEEERILPRLAAKALSILHFDGQGTDLAVDTCNPACYDCLLSYYNQPLHAELDRYAVRDYLLRLAQSQTKAIVVRRRRKELYRILRNQLTGESEAARVFLDHLYLARARMPDQALLELAPGLGRVPLHYNAGVSVLFAEGTEDASIQELEHELLDRGYRVIVVRANTGQHGRTEEFDRILEEHKDVFRSYEV